MIAVDAEFMDCKVRIEWNDGRFVLISPPATSLDPDDFDSLIRFMQSFADVRAMRSP
jgi:hypothetical protein